MQNRILYVLLGLVAVILVVRASVFSVSEGQLAIKSIGGEIVDSKFEPGLHFRVPLVQEVSRFDKRLITQLYRQEPFLTREQEQLKVDFYVKWRINNLRRFYEATGGTEEVANDRLGETRLQRFGRFRRYLHLRLNSANQSRSNDRCFLFA